MKNDIKIALADDHAVLRHGLASMVAQMGYTVLFEADNGKDLIEKIGTGPGPDLVLMDINMPLMDGHETTAWLKNNRPLVKTLALSMYDDEQVIIRMLANGACGYILKDAEARELQAAIEMVMQRGFYFSELVTGKLVYTVNRMNETGGDITPSRLTDREIEFLKLVCTEMPYRSIAQQMSLSPRTIDGYRDALFEKLLIKTRVGLVLYAIKNGIVHM